MMALPITMVWWADRILPPAPNVPWRRWGKALLPIAIVLIIAGYLAAFAAFGNVAWVTHGLAYLYFPVWAAAMALTIRPNPNFGDKNLNRLDRTASLKPRHRQSPIPKRLWTIAWLIAGVGAAALLVAIATGSAPEAAKFSCAVFALMPVFSLGLTHWVLPSTLQEPEPLDAQGNPLLPEEYARFRNERAWTLFALFALAMPIMLLTFGVASLWAFRNGTVGWILGAVGGVTGSVFGLVGAYVGVRADLRRKRLREMLAKAEAAQTSDQMAMSTEAGAMR